MAVTEAVWPADAPAVAALMARAFEVGEMPELVETLKCTGALLFKLDDGTLAGALTYTVAPDGVHVNSLATEKALRRRGVGDALMKAVIRLHGARRITLAIDVNFDAGLRTFYAKYGFRFTGERNRLSNEIWERPPPAAPCSLL